MELTGVYKITSPTNKVYIGQSIDLYRRQSQYERGNIGTQPHLYNSIKKHGWDAHKFEVIFKPFDTTPESLTKWEQFFMDFYRSEGVELMNCKEAGKHGKHSDETREKISIALKGRVFNSGTIEKMRRSAKIRAADPQMKDILISRLKNIPFKALNEIASQLKLIKDANKVVKSKEDKIKSYREGAKKIPILQLTLQGEVIREWECIKDAQTALSLHNIYDVLSGRQKTSGGFKWSKVVQDFE